MPTTAEVTVRVDVTCPCGQRRKGGRHRSRKSKLVRLARIATALLTALAALAQLIRTVTS